MGTIYLFVPALDEECQVLLLFCGAGCSSSHFHVPQWKLKEKDKVVPILSGDAAAVSTVLEFATEGRAVLKEILKRRRGKSVHFFGHSYGAAVGILARFEPGT